MTEKEETYLRNLIEVIRNEGACRTNNTFLFCCNCPPMMLRMCTRSGDMRRKELKYGKVSSLVEKARLVLSRKYKTEDVVEKLL